MKRLLVLIAVISVALGVAVFAKANASPAAYACGSGGGDCPPNPCHQPPYRSGPGRLNGVTGISYSNFWAVGQQSNSVVIQHYNGNLGCWFKFPVAQTGYLQDVSAPSKYNVWAVGGTSSGDPAQTLAMHWTGSTWTKVTTPVQGASATFSGVTAISSTNVWAVGSIGPGPAVRATESPLIEHWNGSTWTTQVFSVPTSGGSLSDVAASSASDVWAVGHTGGTSEDTGQTTMIEHWNGTAWSRVSSPNPAGEGSVLQSVTAISSSNAWAVGYTMTDSGTYQSLTLHWDGSTWSVVTSPNPGGDTNLRGVAGGSASDVWAVGYTGQCQHGGWRCSTVAMHWNGSSWSVKTTLNPSSSFLNAFLGVAYSSGTVYAVGTNDWAGTMIQRWNGSSWTD